MCLLRITRPTLLQLVADNVICDYSPAGKSAQNKYLLFGKNDGKRDDILIDRNECEALVSSINHSPLKRFEGRIELDKTSERLPFEEQAYNSTQLSSALMYLLWGEFNKLLPDSDRDTVEMKGAGTYHI